MLQKGYKNKLPENRRVRSGGDLSMKQNSSSLNFDDNRRKKTHKNKKNNNKFLSIIVVMVLAITIASVSYVSYSINEEKTRGFDVYLGDNHIGTIRTEDLAHEAYHEVEEKLTNTYDMEVVLDKELTFEPTHAKDEELTEKNELVRNIERNINFKVTALEFFVDGESFGIFKSEDEINFVLDRIKEPFVNVIESETRKSVLTKVEFLENIEMKPVEVNYGDFVNEEEMIQLVETIQQGKEEMRTHTVEVGESYWIIARMYETTVDELIEANPGQDPQKLKPGDEVNLFVPVPLLTVVTYEEVEYTEATDYPTEVQQDSSMYKNQKKVVVKGVKGISEIVANEVKHNGVLADREIIEEIVIEEPKKEIVLQGTKELPKTAARGTFIVPTRGRVSSPYGMRGGSMHRGIDIANSVGTPIYAADGGRVTFSGYKGSYGYMVEISHENGYTTRYAHASKLLVKSGDRVYQGQHIANMGSTGRSTGSHLHFEVLVNGVNQNPSRFIY